jgi:SAM-dependent methyltransferase
MSVCAIEHFDDGSRALDEMARVLRPGGELVMSADALTRAAQWPDLYRAHCARYHVKRTYTHEALAQLLLDRGLKVLEYGYQFRARWSELLYLGLSARGGRVSFNAAAALIPLVAASDHLADRDLGSIVLLRACRADK